jgi:hypothetical protein
MDELRKGEPHTLCISQNILYISQNNIGAMNSWIIR